ncbi:Para-hydroxybenzoate--polyprenyltransferase, mitochondrial precursor (PHB:polyprenyltransferase) [Xylographa bjoerkii]|nr:Para-hydroxybenzoate--polyprenyltransferase, mitochondrial precursor (PHB:polyprenyltransferase) [Xylographa bjoerkii]
MAAIVIVTFFLFKSPLSSVVLPLFTTAMFNESSIGKAGEAPPDGKQASPPLPSSRHIRAYIPPTSGFISLLPSSWVPYAELMRLDRPAGFYAYYIPYLVGLGYGACLAQPVPSPNHILGLCGLFLLYCIILRGAACAWNDNVDQKFDRQVARTRLRPIARGAVSTTQAHIFSVALLLAEIPFFMVLPVSCAYHAIPINILFGAYAMMKRITCYPQVVLSFPFAWAILVSCAALGVNPISNHRIVPTMGLFIANILWTIIYDTVYAHQDIRDDIMRESSRWLFASRTVRSSLRPH